MIQHFLVGRRPQFKKNNFSGQLELTYYFFKATFCYKMFKKNEFWKTTSKFAGLNTISIYFKLMLSSTSRLNLTLTIQC